MRAHLHLLRFAAAVVAVGAAGCSNGDGDIASPTAETFETVEATEPLFSRSGDTSGSVATPVDTARPPSTGPSDVATASESTATTAAVPSSVSATVPDTGVPGIDSPDAFCRAWSEFAGSFQALAGAWSLGDPSAAARLEVAASAALVAAVTSLDENLPPELESERAAVAALVEPLARRAAAADDALDAAGLSSSAIVALGEAWLEALSAAGVDDPTISIVVPSEVDETALAEAVAAFAAARPSITEDPSMITDVRVPQTEQYLIVNCPDQGTLGGNDVIEG